ncbi:hypothetical protein BGZ73_008547 [Actinomortierella ambigua]|nr:hypothetical protein BGZ73_008547 [Actinomortierella ambigua]
MFVERQRQLQRLYEIREALLGDLERIRGLPVTTVLSADHFTHYESWVNMISNRVQQIDDNIRQHLLVLDLGRALYSVTPALSHPKRR